MDQRKSGKSRSKTPYSRRKKGITTHCNKLKGNAERRNLSAYTEPKKLGATANSSLLKDTRRYATIDWILLSIITFPSLPVKLILLACRRPFLLSNRKQLQSEAYVIRHNWALCTRSLSPRMKKELRQFNESWRFTKLESSIYIHISMSGVHKSQFTFVLKTLSRFLVTNYIRKITALESSRMRVETE